MTGRAEPWPEEAALIDFFSALPERPVKYESTRDEPYYFEIERGAQGLAITIDPLDEIVDLTITETAGDGLVVDMKLRVSKLRLQTTSKGAFLLADCVNVARIVLRVDPDIHLALTADYAD